MAVELDRPSPSSAFLSFVRLESSGGVWSGTCTRRWPSPCSRSSRSPNAGISFAGVGFADPLTLGIALGLFLGNPVGILRRGSRRDARQPVALVLGGDNVAHAVRFPPPPRLPRPLPRPG